ncbi:TetR family transcriptional regulator [Mycobacterium sp. 852002-53434_SCH5985345]|uniref:TetR/AcrR family transcriptional regulator n=1 Tax=unclassified Mycobacterium TaxID=2642494 RepID=UPI0007FC422D|nr:MULTISPECIES: TetR/AcrR family transcriptional regulator [unclassified Mycobacterium]OBF50346.1 TetR family transcriptional regulator [Mycobacterium sp. 852002-53434_SCH5985345]OBF77732.1 TetR family transcriptional regulator [Mycobacterium sp. 852002-51613_SCH5001154]OBF96518.1 TetR family transcriptional regulator [Mycobacterium sp. 852014-52450_SCH5900713]
MLLVMSPVKPPRTRPTRDEVRDRILDAASKVFAAEGFAGATIDAIGQAAGFTKGAVYSNFESKDELVLALLDRQFELRGEQIATALDSSGGDIGAAARELSRSVLDTVRDHSDYYVLFVEYWLRAQRDPQLRERLIERRRAAAADQALHIVRSTASEASDRELVDVAQLVVTINLGIAMEEILRPGAMNPDLLAQLITAALESVLVSAEQGGPHHGYK